jgi:hypothetical protein
MRRNHHLRDAPRHSWFSRRLVRATAEPDVVADYLRALAIFTDCVIEAGITHLRAFMVVTVAVASPGLNGPSVETSATLHGSGLVLHVIGVVETAWTSTVPRPLR